MKKTITKLNALILFLSISFCTQAQVYVMVQDMSIRSDSMHTDTSVAKYVWNSQLHLTKINHFFGSNSMPSGYDLVYINSSGRIDSLIEYDQGNNPTSGYLKNTWSGNDLMMQERGQKNGMGGPLSKRTTTYIYNAGKLITWIQHSDTFGGGGNNGPDSVTNMVFTNGNGVSGVIYSKGALMGNVALEYDSMPNPYKGWAVNDNFPDFFTANNLRKVYLTSPYKLFNLDALTYANGMLASKTQNNSNDFETHSYTYAYMVGMSEITSDKLLTLYPNPSTEGIFNIDLSNIKSLKSIDVYDVTGRTIMSENNFSNNSYTKINLINQPKGIYFLQIKTADNIKTARMIIE